MTTKDTIDLVFSFDTTGSMYPCLTQVRKEVKETVQRLFDEIPTVRIGIIAHGEKDAPIADFVKANGLSFKIGRGFYEFTKPVEVQDHKEVILQEKTSGDMFTGKKARELLGLPEHGTVKIKPGDLGTYRAFIQSTSANRKLLGGTHFLYEIEDLDAEAAA
jgi:hypothetical protein